MAFTNKEYWSMRRSREMRYHREWAVRKWKDSFTDDWDYEYLLVHLRAKLETMERYNLHLSYALNGPYYGHQIGRAIRMIDIILQEGGRSDYDEREDYTPVPETFKHYVNMRNRSRIPDAAGGRIYFRSDAQHLRFDKAWMLLWKILSEQSMAWGD
jgi:hypothetical protein